MRDYYNELLKAAERDFKLSEKFIVYNGIFKAAKYSLADIRYTTDREGETYSFVLVGWNLSGELIGRMPYDYLCPFDVLRILREIM